MFSTFFTPSLTTRTLFSHPTTHSLRQLAKLAQCVTHESLSDRSARAYLSHEASQYTLNIKLPELIGRDLSNLELQLEDQVLTLSIPAMNLPEIEGLQTLWEEIPTQARVENFRLPPDVEIEQISATLKGDQLEIKLPKRTQVKRSIKIVQNMAS